MVRRRLRHARSTGRRPEHRSRPAVPPWGLSRRPPPSSPSSPMRGARPLNPAARALNQRMRPDASHAYIATDNCSRKSVEKFLRDYARATIRLAGKRAHARLNMESSGSRAGRRDIRWCAASSGPARPSRDVVPAGDADEPPPSRLRPKLIEDRPADLAMQPAPAVCRRIPLQRRHPEHEVRTWPPGHRRALTGLADPSPTPADLAHPAGWPRAALSPPGPAFDRSSPLPPCHDR